jgi:RND family efflux transporter MFP subunit
MTVRRRNQLLLGAFIILILGGVIGWFSFGQQRSVVAATPTRGAAVEAVYATGAVEPVFWAKVSTTVVGRIVAIPLKEGAAVKAGDVLIKLDNREALARLAEAAARRKFLAEELARYTKLATDNVASRRVYQQALSRHAEALATENVARQRLQDLTIRAPLDGDILRLDVNVGEVIRAGDVLAWVGKCCPMRIEAEVDEEDIPRVKKGQNVLVKADAFPGKSYAAKVSSITPKGDPISKNYRVRITLPKGSPLRIGMTTEVNIIARETKNALLIPIGALRKNSVWIVEKGRAILRKVTTGVVGDRKVEITKGLTGSDLVMQDPPQDLKVGEKVKVTAPEPKIENRS